MDAKYLKLTGLKTATAKCQAQVKGKDTALIKALETHEKLAEEKLEERAKALAAMLKAAGDLKKIADAAKLTDVGAYLKNVLAAATEAQKEVTQGAKAAVDAKKLEAARAKQTDLEEEEEESGDAFAKLTAALKVLRTAKAPYYFLLCDAKPYGLVVSKKDITKSSAHKKELSQIAGGSTRAPRSGTCRVDNGKFVFEMEKPPSGLAAILQKWLKTNLGMVLKIKIGTEEVGDDEAEAKEPVSKGPSPKAAAEKVAQKIAEAKAAAVQAVAERVAAAKQAAAELKEREETRNNFKKARASWIAVKARAEADLEKVKDGARTHYLADADQYPKIEKGCADIDAILDNLDDELRDTLDTYAATPLRDKAKLQELAGTADEVLDRYHAYVEKDPILKAIDQKEFANVTVHAPVLKALRDLRKALS